MLPGRVTDVDVAKIVEVDEDVESLDDYIDAANELVTEVCASVTAADGVTPYYGSSRLATIEKWLAAHFYCIFDPRASRERVAVITTEFMHKVGLGLDVTTYGQQAKLLDTKGGLARLDAMMKNDKRILNVRASMKWVGTPIPDEV